MNTNFNCIFRSIPSFFKESVLPSLTSQQKKILMIASAFFAGLLVCCYALKSYCFKATKNLDVQENKEDFDFDLDGDETDSEDDVKGSVKGSKKSVTNKDPKNFNKVKSGSKQLQVVGYTSILPQDMLG